VARYVMRFLKLVLVAACLVAAARAGAEAHSTQTVCNDPRFGPTLTWVSSPPPPTRHESVTPAESGSVWVEGYWDWRESQWRWVRGCWAPPSREFVRPAFFSSGSGGTLRAGYWRPRTESVLAMIGAVSCGTFAHHIFTAKGEIDGCQCDPGAFPDPAGSGACIPIVPPPTPEPDLAALSVSGPLEAIAGEDITASVCVRIQNVGQRTVGVQATVLYLTASSAGAPRDPWQPGTIPIAELGSTRTGDLAAGEVFAYCPGRLPVMIPRDIPPGVYWLTAWTFPTPPDPNPSNETAVSVRPVCIQNPAFIRAQGRTE